MNLDVSMLARRHWFYAALPLWLVAALAFQNAHSWSEQPLFGEAVTLLDWCVFIPILFVICYRDMPPRALILRALAMVCGGIWIASQIVPDQAETILAQWGWLRGVGIAVLLLFEGLVVIAILRIVFGAASDVRQLERHGIPAVFIKLIVAEARFWRWVWARLTGR